MAGSDNGTTAIATEVATNGFANKVTELVENLGKSLVAFTLGVDVSTVGRWAKAHNLPKNLETERKIENFYTVFRFLIKDAPDSPERSPHEVRSWLMGINPHLDDGSPAEALREGKYRPVMAAARAYAAGG